MKSLEAALWAFHKSATFEEICLLAVNLGDDADTTAAIYGQIAGAYYGIDGIPHILARAHRSQRTHYRHGKSSVRGRDKSINEGVSRLELFPHPDPLSEGRKSKVGYGSSERGGNNGTQ